MSDLILYALLNCKCSIHKFESIDGFPEQGNPSNFYIDMSDKHIYIYDSQTNEYVDLSTGGNGSGGSTGNPLKSGRVGKCTTNDSPKEGFKVGDMYIDLVLKDNTHVYILANDLVEGVGEPYFVDNVKKGEIFSDYTSNVASGVESEAHNHNNDATGDYSFVCGVENETSGTASFSANSRNIASGNFSSAFGYLNEANGNYSFVNGFNNKANGVFQTVIGRLNVVDEDNKYAFIVGNGASNENETHSNAFAIDWNGLIYVNNSETGIDLNQLQQTIENLSNGGISGGSTSIYVENDTLVIDSKQSTIEGNVKAFDLSWNFINKDDVVISELEGE